MRTRRIVLTLIAGGLLLACNLPLAAPTIQPSTAPSNGSSPLTAATALPPTPTVPPPASPTATAIPTPTVPQVTPLSVNDNCRSGPDVSYDSVGALMFGAIAQVAGRNDNSSWWYIHDPSNSGGFCWVAASVVAISGPLAGIPVVAPPAATVTKVTVDVSLPSTVFCGGPNAVEFSGSITTNGPMKVDFQWETGGDKSNPPVTDTLTFKAAGTKDAPSPGAYPVDCGHYTITLHVTSPNDISATKNYKVAE